MVSLAGVTNQSVSFYVELDAIKAAAYRGFLHPLRGLPSRKRPNDTVRGRSLQLAAVMCASLPHHHRLEARAGPRAQHQQHEPATAQPSPLRPVLRACERSVWRQQQPRWTVEHFNCLAEQRQCMLNLARHAFQGGVQTAD